MTRNMQLKIKLSCGFYLGKCEPFSFIRKWYSVDSDQNEFTRKCCCFLKPGTDFRLVELLMANVNGKSFEQND